jgi:hypothetical protein
LSEQALSSLFARSRQLWHVDLAPNCQPVTIELEAVIKLIHCLERDIALEIKALQSIPNLVLTNKHDLLQAEHHQPTADKAFAYLGLESCHIQTALVRTSSDRLADQFLNY